MLIQQNERIWNDGSFPQINNRLKKSEYRDLGIDPDQTLVEVATLEQLRRNPPNIVIAEAIKNLKFIQNWVREQELKKKVRYVMGLGVFNQLQYANNGTLKILKPAPMKFKNLYKPYIGQDLTDKTILVFRTGGIGDLLFIQPNLRYLKKKYPTCKILFACGPQYQTMVENWTDCVDEVLDLPFVFQKLIQSDYHVLFEGVIERCIQARTVNAYNLFSKWMGLDLPDELLIPRQEAKDEKLAECIDILEKNNIKIKDFLLLQLRASSPIRTPNHMFWVKIINELNKRHHKVVITDNPRQHNNIDKFIKLLDKPGMVFNFAKYSETLDYSIALTKLTKSTITTDSAFSHIAASLDIPCFGIYGPFPGEIRLKTYPKACWINSKRHCAPCFLHGHKPCPQAASDKYSPCYNEFDINEILSEIEKHLIDKG